MCWDMMLWCSPSIMHLFMICFYKIIKSIFHTQPTNLAPFSQVFLYKQFVEYVQVVVLYVIYFHDKINFLHKIWSTLLLWLGFYFLKWNRCFSTFQPVNLVPRTIFRRAVPSFSPSSNSEKMRWDRGCHPILAWIIYLLITARSMYELTSLKRIPLIEFTGVYSSRVTKFTNIS